MLALLLTSTLLLPTDLAARNLERDRQLKETLPQLDFEPARAGAAEELLKSAPPMECTPVRGPDALRCALQVPTGEPTLCWHGAVVAMIYQRQLQMETGDPENVAFVFACGAELVSGRLHGTTSKGRLKTTIELSRRTDARKASARLQWQPVTLPATNPVGWELRLRPAERRVRLAVADALAVVQAPGQQVAPARVDVVAACKAARAEVQAAPAFGGDDSFRQATLSWIGAVEADHAGGPLRALLDRARSSSVSSPKPEDQAALKALVDEVRRAEGERDAGLERARQRFRAAHPFSPAP